VVVQAGDTLWGIAQELAPGQDPRSVVGQIRELNDLGTDSIVPGQTLVLPTLG
jgi:LysM repeat protein